MFEDFINLKTDAGSVRVAGKRAAFFGVEKAVFANWNFDGETLRVENDVYGFYPLFYWQNKNGIVVSPSLVKLLEAGSPTDFDDAGLAVFLRLGFFIGEDTPFQAIRALPPGAKLIWRDGKIDLTSSGCFISPKTDLTAREVVAAISESFRKSVAAMLPPDENFAVPLSAGRDSRFILFELLRGGAKPRECLTLQHFPPRANEDERIAKLICEKFDLPHKILPQPASPLRAEIEKNLSTNFCTDEHAWYLPLARRIEEQNFARIYDGIAGDVLTGGVVFDPPPVQVINPAFEVGDFKKAAEEMLSEGYLPNLLRKKVLQQFNRELAVERLSSELSRHAEAANPIVSFLFYNRTRREIALAPFGILNRYTTVCTPFLDKKLFELLMSVPFKMSDETKLRDAAINLSFPEFADIEYENKQAAPVRDLKFSRRCNLDLLRYANLTKSSKLIHKSFWSTRVARGLIDRNFAESIYYFGGQTIYLLQLERLINDLNN